MTKHTPGPWRVQHEQGDMPYIVAEQGKNWNNPIVCQLYEDVTPEDSVTMGPWLKAYPDADANARLIAAAPEMLEALEQFSNYVMKEQCSTDGLVTYSTTTINHFAFLARAAIAKATGEDK